MKKKFNGHALSIVLVIMMNLFTFISYHYYQIKVLSKTHEQVKLAYQLSFIEMKCISYIDYCLAHDLEIENHLNQNITFEVFDNEIKCHLLYNNSNIDFIVYFNNDDKIIKNIKFV